MFLRLIFSVALLSSIIAAASLAPYLVVSLPFSIDSNKFSVLKWDNTTIDAVPGSEFDLQKVSEGTITFVRNGEVGMVATDKGKVGLFSLDSQGTSTVINDAYRPKTCYADSVVADPSDSSRAFILDVNSDGGICAVAIDSSKNIQDSGQLISLVNPKRLLFPSANTNIAAVVSLTGVVSIVDLAAGSTLSSAFAFDTSNRDGSADALVSDAALTADNKYILVLDNNFVTGTMRLSAVSVDTTVSPPAITLVQVINKLNDPAAIVPSPFNDAALVASAEGNELILVSYDSTSSSSTPLAILGPIETTTKPQLPSNLVAMSGAEATPGLIAVAELQGVRQLQFHPSSASASSSSSPMPTVEDLGLSTLGEGSGSIVGAIGAQPVQ